MYVSDAEEQVCFSLEVRVPFARAAAFADALTGDDLDIILAAEHAMRDKLGWAAGEDIELYPEGSTPVDATESTLQTMLRDAARASA